jgi:diguanylate cyclase (GGDEF)-like protein
MDETIEPQRIQLFPVAIGGQIRGGVIFGTEFFDENVTRHISRFTREVSAELEILRLREQVERQSSLSNALQKFNQSLKEIDAEDFCELLARVSTEIMGAERGSLLAFDEATQGFIVKAAVGTHADVIKEEKENLGGKIAYRVLEQGKPLIVRDINAAGVPAAPEKFKYKTHSFISYPIILNNRKIGVFNVTDKVDGGVYDEADLQLLNTSAPQLAIALDRAELQRKAGEFEKLSITDPLTGLLNRRYLEARLMEEIKRSQRHGFPMSFLMIDVDEFKSYNDTFTHPEGDKALQLVGGALKATLRGADVAARYGGEEFSILLPQTTLSEAYLIAERIRERVEATRFPKRQVTVSIGIAACSPELSTAEALISAADKAVYEAKRTGRNNVKIFKTSEIEDINSAANGE